MPPPSDPRNLRAKWQRALEERRRAGAVPPPLDVTPGARREPAARPAEPETPAPAKEARTSKAEVSGSATEARASNAEASGSAKATRAPNAEAGGSAKAIRSLKTETESAASGAASETAAANTDAPSATTAAPAAKIDVPAPAPAPAPGAAASREDGDAAKKAAPAPSPWSSIVAALVLVGGVGIALRTFITPSDAPSEPPEEDVGSGAPALEPSGSAAAPLGSAPPAPVKPRCSPPAKEPFVIGDAPAPKPAASAGDGDDGRDDELAPFAVELGRGVRFEGGFAVGTQRQAEGGTVSMVAFVGPDGEDGRLVRLARSRGDFDPPVVAAAGGAILAAMMEPNAGGRSIRIARVDGDRVTWGPELSESNDESLAVDIAASGAHALAVWDDVPLGRERSVIELASFDVAAMRGSGARPVTPPSIDADVPRLAPRPGGFWLSYLVHGDPPTTPTAEKDDEPEDAGAKKPGKSKAPANPDDSDTEAAGEAIAHQWVELVPLDATGFPAGAPRAVTPKDGHVNGYDLDDGEDGRAVVLYREDDTPSGSYGGRIKVVIAELGGVAEPHVLAEEGVGSGVPLLYGSWVVVHSLSGPVQLGTIGPAGDLASALQPEATLKLGEILTAHQDAFLVATPAGKAMKLGVVRCTR